MRSLPYSIRALLASVLGVALIAGAVLVGFGLERSATNRGFERTETADALLNAMLDRETGLRGFLLTDDVRFLAPYDEGLTRFAAVDARARDDVAGVAAARPALADQERIAALWQRQATAAIAAVSRRGVQRITLRSATARKETMDAFRAANARYLAAMTSARRRDLSDATIGSTLLAIGAALVFAATAVAFAVFDRRRQREADAHVREAAERERRYTEGRYQFARVMQLSDSEQEARGLLRERVEAGIRGAQAVVLNRNNSADRLEATTPVRDPALERGLAGARPRSCLAIRQAQRHEAGGEPGPISCEVCGGSEGRTTCEPLLVSGEVIGSLLIQHPEPLGEDGIRLVRDSVSHVSPVLANLRNLAIAERRAHTDSLTGLPNRRSMDDTLRLLLAHAARTETPLSAILIDLDHFKLVNDTYGHDRGDDLLAAVATATTSCVRTSDFAARMGGEEFVILLPATDIAGAERVAGNIAAALSRVRVPGLETKVTASFGVAAFPEHGLDGASLLRSADRALYEAKRAGRDCIRLAVGVEA